GPRGVEAVGTGVDLAPRGAAHDAGTDGVAVRAVDRVPGQHDPTRGARGGDVGRHGGRPDRDRTLRGDVGHAVPEAPAGVQGEFVGVGDLVLAPGVGVQPVVAGLAAVDPAGVVAGPVHQRYRPGAGGAPGRYRVPQHPVVRVGVDG